MKRKLIIALLTTTMALSPISVFAAEFTGGSDAAETQDAVSSSQADDTGLFMDDSDGGDVR